MSRIHVEAAALIPAAPESVYAVFRDYRNAHPAVLPRRYFKSVTVEHGGEGAGTMFRVHMSVMGVQREMQMKVSEPEPGRVLVETETRTGLVTTFTVTPAGEGHSHVRIATDWDPAPGLAGLMDRLSTPMMRRIYGQELRNLDQYVQVRHP